MGILKIANSFSVLLNMKQHTESALPMNSIFFRLKDMRKFPDHMHEYNYRFSHINGFH